MLFGLLTAALKTLPAFSQELIAYLALGNAGYWQAWLMDDKAQEKRQLTFSPYDKNRLSWFPDGRHLLINGSQGELEKVAVFTGKSLPVSAGLKGFIDGVISPNGHAIAFSLSTSNSIDDNNIWIASLEETSAERLHFGVLNKITNMAHMQHEPTWAKDGQSLYFLSGDGGEAHDIWSVNLKSANKKQLTANALYHFDLAVDDKGRMAFSNNKTGQYDIWLQEPTGTKIQLTTDKALDSAPSFSADGQHLVFQSSRDGYYNLWKMNLNTKEIVPLTQGQQGARHPVYRPRVK